MIKKDHKYLIEGNHPILRYITESAKDDEDRDTKVEQLMSLGYEVSVKLIRENAAE